MCEGGESPALHELTKQTRGASVWGRRARCETLSCPPVVRASMPGTKEHRAAVRDEAAPGWSRPQAFAIALVKTGRAENPPKVARAESLGPRIPAPSLNPCPTLPHAAIQDGGVLL